MAEALSFPDQTYIDHLREALWRRSVSYAAVMVGAGFSLNAIPIQSGLFRMPTWGNLVERLVDDLYPPHDPGAKVYRNRALKDASATSGMLRLAEEHATAFGRDYLDKRLLEFVPDLSFEPGPLHELLLSLPWRDVFTTNWDTLLERCARRLPERDYETIGTPSDISRSGQPRIVKLHGSFPHTRPFIASEEDYRTYPERLGPFVNMVRQTAMECILCLVGFSGSDPNFLAWTGWVRDQLGPYQPHIYLASLEGHSSAQRQLLEKRGIRLIDLDRLSGLHRIPTEAMHAAALEWFLKNLMAGRPSTEPLDWPDPSRGPAAAGHPDLPPIPPGSSPRFPGQPGIISYEDQNASSAIRSASLWREAREAYPGWLIAPKEVRRRIWSRLEHLAFTIPRCLRDAPPLTRLHVIRELLWQLDTCLMPPPETSVALIRQTIEDLGPVRA